jgi:hypothetical protein
VEVNSHISPWSFSVFFGILPRALRVLLWGVFVVPAPEWVLLMRGVGEVLGLDMGSSVSSEEGGNGVTRGGMSLVWVGACVAGWLPMENASWVGVVSELESVVEGAVVTAFLVFFSFGMASGSVLDITLGRLPSRESVTIRDGGGDDSLT